MRRTVLFGQTVRAVLDTSTAPYICRQCLAQARSRTFHSSIPRQDREPEWKKTMNRLIGSKKETQAIEKLDAAQAKKVDIITAGQEIEPKTLNVDGVEYKVAMKFVPRVHPDYIPAAKLQDLSTIGSEKWVKMIADQGEQYSSFIPPKRPNMTEVEWQSLLRHELIQILALVKNGQKADAIFEVSKTQTRSLTEAVALRVRSGSVELVYPSPLHEAGMLETLTQTIDDSASDTLAPAVDAPKDRSWMDVPLEDPVIKLAFIKRVMQTTGYRVPDVEVSKAADVRAIYRALIAKPAPKKLVQTKQVQALSIDLPNVTVHNSRQTVVHKEKNMGRWKLIKQELRRRNLPVTGSSWTNAKINSMVRPKKPKKHAKKSRKSLKISA